jgi:hypothetical protein
VDGEIARLVAEVGCGAAFVEGDANGLAVWISRMSDAPEEAVQAGSLARQYWQKALGRNVALDRWMRCLRQLSINPSTP